MAIIQKDIIGLYVKAGGYVARPFHDGAVEEILSNATTNSKTSFKEGDKVQTKHHGGSILSTIKNDSIKEIWSVGGYLDMDEYKYAKEYYFKTEEEFNDYILLCAKVKNIEKIQEGYRASNNKEEYIKQDRENRDYCYKIWKVIRAEHSNYIHNKYSKK